MLSSYFNKFVSPGLYDLYNTNKFNTRIKYNILVDYNHRTPDREYIKYIMKTHKIISADSRHDGK